MRNHGPLDFTDAEKAQWLRDRGMYRVYKDSVSKQNTELLRLQRRLKKKAYYLYQAGYPKPFTRDDYWTEAIREYNRRNPTALVPIPDYRS
jgi:hypothetical protein